MKVREHRDAGVMLEPPQPERHRDDQIIMYGLGAGLESSGAVYRQLAREAPQLAQRSTGSEFEFFSMVETAGFEPATPCVQSKGRGVRLFSPRPAEPCSVWISVMCCPAEFA